jgi:hypothetical protein
LRAREVELALELLDAFVVIDGCLELLSEINRLGFRRVFIGVLGGLFGG